MNFHPCSWGLVNGSFFLENRVVLFWKMDQGSNRLCVQRLRRMALLG